MIFPDGAHHLSTGGDLRSSLCGAASGSSGRMHRRVQQAKGIGLLGDCVRSKAAEGTPQCSFSPPLFHISITSHSLVHASFMSSYLPLSRRSRLGSQVIVLLLRQVGMCGCVIK